MAEPIKFNLKGNRCKGLPLHICEKVTLKDEHGHKIKLHMLVDSGATATTIVDENVLKGLDLVKTCDPGTISGIGGECKVEHAPVYMEFGNGCKGDTVILIAEGNKDLMKEFGADGLLGALDLQLQKATVDFKKGKVKC